MLNFGIIDEGGSGVAPPETCELSIFANACFVTDLADWINFSMTAVWQPDESVTLSSAAATFSGFYQNFTLDENRRYSMALTGGSADLYWIVNDVVTNVPTTSRMTFNAISTAVSIGVGSMAVIAEVNVDSILLWDAGEAVKIAPSEITDFVATDDEIGQVTVTFSNSIGIPIPTYNLFQDNVSVATGITSPYVHTVAAGSYTFRVDAVNEVGTTASNDYTGVSLSTANRLVSNTGNPLVSSSGNYIVADNSTAVTYNGENVTHNGETVTYTI